jgi:AcrR family transcriptional regulator
VSAADATTAPDRGRPPGRPRSAEADAAILGATLELLLEEGYRTLSMESVRARAGVGKATIYRRFKSKQELVTAALEQLTDDFRAPEDTGSFRGDIEALLAQAAQTMYLPRIATFMPRLMAEAVEDEALFELFHARLVTPRRVIVRQLVERGMARGEVRADLDPETVIDVLVGPLIYRVIITAGRLERLGRGPLDAFDAVFDGLRPR